MKVSLAAVVLALFVAGCGDNIVPEGSPTKNSPSATSAVGGSQVSHSKSFMLVTSVAAEHAQVMKSTKFTIKPGVGGE
jgi:hypothetical protein